MYLNEATLLNNVRVRYSKDHIYVRPLPLLYVSVYKPFITIQLLHEGRE